MLYIKLDSDMNLVITVKEPIYRGDNLSRKISYLIPVTVGDVDMLTATVYLNYIRSDGTPDVVMLERQEEKYSESYFQYILPITCKISKYAGEVCTWMQICSGPASNPTVAKSGECVLRVLESKDMDEYIGDRTITALYQLKKHMDDGFETMESSIDALIAEKADNIVFNEEDSTLQLIANGAPIGDRVVVSTNIGVGVKDMGITVDGELIAVFDDGTMKNLGCVVGSDGVVYVPHIDEHKVLTFTIEESPGEVPPAVDLNPNDEWSEVDGNSVETDYIWESIAPN